MIVRRLREKKGWSQEQLAELSGVSLRTVQRVEAGNRASLETLKSLASVFEVKLESLTEQILVIDKESDAWQSEPWPIRMFLYGMQKRHHMMLMEYFLIAAGIASWILSSEIPITTPLAFLGAYVNARLVAYVDQKAYW